VVQNTIAGVLTRRLAAHAAHDWRRERVVPHGVPVEQPGQSGERHVSHAAATLILDPVEQPDYVLATDGADRRAAAENRINQPFERGFALAERAQGFTLALEVRFGHCT